MRDIIGERSASTLRPPNQLPVREVSMAVKKCNTCGCVQPLSNFCKHPTLPGGLAHKCRACAKIYNDEYRKKNREKEKENGRKYYEANKEKVKANAMKWAAANRDKVCKKGKRYYAENKEKHSQLTKKWRETNIDRARALCMLYYTTKMQAFPRWADKDKIQSIYSEAARLGMHVDHIVPLRSKVVCGLHCEFNLQPLPGSENSKKGNRYWPDMP